MSIKQRMNAIEHKLGIRIEPLVIFVVRRGRREETIGSHKKAVIIGSSTKKCEDVFMRYGETSAAFEARVMEMSSAGN